MSQLIRMEAVLGRWPHPTDRTIPESRRKSVEPFGAAVAQRVRGRTVEDVEARLVSDRVMRDLVRLIDSRAKGSVEMLRNSPEHVGVGCIDVVAHPAAP